MKVCMLIYSLHSLMLLSYIIQYNLDIVHFLFFFDSLCSLDSKE